LIIIRFLTENFEIPGANYNPGFYRRSNRENEKPPDSYSKTGATPLVLKEKRGLEPD
jgi:hypothetical protein